MNMNVIQHEINNKEHLLKNVIQDRLGMQHLECKTATTTNYVEDTEYNNFLWLVFGFILLNKYNVMKR